MRPHGRQSPSKRVVTSHQLLRDILVSVICHSAATVRVLVSINRSSLSRNYALQLLLSRRLPADLRASLLIAAKRRKETLTARRINSKTLLAVHISSFTSTV